MHYSYCVYYDKDPNRTGHKPLTIEQVDVAFSKIPDAIMGYLVDDPLAAISSGPMLNDPNSRRVVVLTTLSEKVTEAAVKSCAHALNLCATRLAGV